MKKYIEKNKSNLLLLLTIYVVGIIVGLLLFIIIQSESKSEIISSIQNTVNLATDGSFSGINILKNGLQTNSIFLILLIFSSFTIIAFPVIAFIIFLKGISLSMYICILFKIFGIWKGLLAMFGIAIIPSIIVTIAYIFLGNECYHSNLKLLIRINNKSIIKNIFSNVTKALAIIPFIILSIYIEQIFFKIVIGI